jgi:hypothetical protein
MFKQKLFNPSLLTWSLLENTFVPIKCCRKSNIPTKIIMRNKKQLWKLVESISDLESRERKSTKPFTPHYMDGLISYVAPHFYSNQELNQILHLSSIYNKAIEEKKGKKRIIVTPAMKKSRKRFFSKLRKGSTSKKESDSNRASTMPPPPVLVPRSNRRAFSL